ncbi:MAG TPA: hypothetical protein VJG64_01255 [Candidatus Paceibacterota bacterium]
MSEGSGERPRGRERPARSVEEAQRECDTYASEVRVAYLKSSPELQGTLIQMGMEQDKAATLDLNALMATLQDAKNGQGRRERVELFATAREYLIR